MVTSGKLELKTTLVSYNRISLRSGYYSTLVPVVKILKKRGHQKNLGENGVKLLRNLTEKSVNFSTLATSNIRLLLFFVEEDQQTKLVRLLRKKIHGH